MFREALRLNNVLAPGWPTRPLADKAPRSTTTGPQTEETRWAGSNKNGESKNKVDLRVQSSVHMQPPWKPDSRAQGLNMSVDLPV